MLPGKRHTATTSRRFWHQLETGITRNTKRLQSINHVITQHILRLVHRKAGLSRFGPVGCLTALPGTYFDLHLFRI